MTSMTSEQLKQFAEACGWTYVPIHQPDTAGFYNYWITPTGSKYASLPDFLHSKDAVIEALEWFCDQYCDHDRYDICSQRRDGQVLYDVTLYLKRLAKLQPSFLEGPAEPTLNEAIILAVRSVSNRES